MVHDASGMVVTTIPTSPGTQSSMLQTRRDVDRILRGLPARPAADHHGLHGERRVTEEPRRPAPARERPLKERFQPESVDVGPLGYTAAEIFARMPPPAQPAEQVEEEEEEPDWDKDPEVVAGHVRKLFPQCDRCRLAPDPDERWSWSATR